MTNQFMTWLAGAIGVLAAAIGVLWRTMTTKQEASDILRDKQYADLQGRAIRYEEKYDTSIEKILKLTEATSSLEGKVNGYLEAKTDLQALSDNVLDLLQEKKK